MTPPPHADSYTPGISAMLSNTPCGHPIFICYVTAADADRLAAGQTIYCANDPHGQLLGVHMVLMGGENHGEISERLTDMIPQILAAAHHEHYGQ